MLETTQRTYRLTLVEQLLGSTPKDRNVYQAYIEARAAKAGATATPEAAVASEHLDVQETEERGWTGFLQDGAGIYLLDYVIRGFFKSAARVLDLSLPGKKKSSVALGPSIIDNYVFVRPRQIRLFHVSTGQAVVLPDGVLERSLRAMTAMGPRVTVMRSDYVAEGAFLDVTIELIGDRITHELIEQLLDYGRFQGLGQWRNGSYGRFEWATLE